MKRSLMKPTSGSTFSSLEEVVFYYRQYAKQTSFAVIRRGIKKKGNRDVYIILACIREGKQRKSKSDAKKAIPKIIRTWCKARICAMLCANRMWRLSNVMLQHNHDLSPEKAKFFRCNKNIDAAVKRRLELNDIAGVRTNKNFNSLVVERGGYENIPFGKKDCQNFIDKTRELRLGKGGA
ncbi:protein FAR-RED IMPAIRED RESPONSE 1-like [Alnus glutinosa]|uniref:protein FAR-RED IMPAIRED RESPONSE 1-like n=1 Tax=Alnus glutinosa TaxID=3517 RepID=UPI002D7A02BE|nr:protein FAR-RED IMPAIRED RESPONSE 1-like [Alnus glutinosa]